MRGNLTRLSKVSLPGDAGLKLAGEKTKCRSAIIDCKGGNFGAANSEMIHLGVYSAVTNSKWNLLHFQINCTHHFFFRIKTIGKSTELPQFSAE